MGKIVSAAGEVAFVLKLVRTGTNGFVIIGRMGVWDAEVYLSYKEMLGSLVTPKTLLAMLKIPILLSRGIVGEVRNKWKTKEDHYED